MPTTKAPSRHRWLYFTFLLAILIGGIAVAYYYLGNFILVIAALIILVRIWLAACDRWPLLGRFTVGVISGIFGNRRRW